MKLRHVLPLLLMLSLCLPTFAHANPNSGPQVNLHRKFVVQQTKRRAAQGKSTRRHVGVWLSGGYNRSVTNARRARFRRW